MEKLFEWRVWQNKELIVRNKKRRLEFSSEVSAACGARVAELEICTVFLVFARQTP